MRERATLRNVTLRAEPSPEDIEGFLGKIFPCPICGNGLPIGLTFKGKPYCTCNDCGLQLFFRGKLGIERLRKLLASGKFIPSDAALAGDPLALINRLEKLRIQKRDLEAKQGLIFENKAISDAISVVDTEIAEAERELEKRAAKGKKK